MTEPPSSSLPAPRSIWWETPGFAVALVVLAAVPLLWPPIPPLTDLMGHMARWHVSMALGRSPALQQFYSFHWQLVGNLGMDLLVPAVARLIGIEPATKFVVLLIPPLTTIGLLWSAKEAHGRLPATVLPALPLAYAWPFQFGFVNYALAQALALVAFALWLRLGRQGRTGLRAILFVPIACLLWVAHDFGWGLFGLLAFAAELARQRDLAARWPQAIGRAALHGAPLALPALAMLGGAHLSHGLGAQDFFDVATKLSAIVSSFQDPFLGTKIPWLVVPFFLLYCAARHRHLSFERTLGWPALLVTLAFLGLPRMLLDGAYVDMRLAPTALMLALLAIRPVPREAPRFARTVAMLCLAFFGARLVLQTITYQQRAQAQQAELGAIGAIPHGAAILSLVARGCSGPLGNALYDHLASMAVVRRDAFVNDQWDIAGQQLLGIRYRIAAPYLSDPSQLVLPPTCPDVRTRFDTAIAGFNRRAFHYVWTIGFPPGRAKAPDLTLVWSNGRSALYRVRGAPPIAGAR